MNFEVLWVFPKAFSAKFEDVAFIGSTSEQSAKVFSAKIVFSTNLQKLVFLQYGNKRPTMHTLWEDCTESIHYLTTVLV